MPEDEKLARCIFNDAAQKRYLSANANGLQFRARRGNIFFRAISSKVGTSVLELEFLPTGRRSIDLPHRLLNGRFVQMFQKPGAFLVLHDALDGWIRIEHVDISTAPKLPYARIWPIAYTEHPVGSSNQYKITMAQKVVLAAAATIHEYAMEKRIGRPPKAVQEAREIITSYKSLMADLANVERQSIEA